MSIIGRTTSRLGTTTWTPRLHTTHHGPSQFFNELFWVKCRVIGSRCVLTHVSNDELHITTLSDMQMLLILVMAVLKHKLTRPYVIEDLSGVSSQQQLDFL
jgi:hypothetical protein